MVKLVIVEDFIIIDVIIIIVILIIFIIITIYINIINVLITVMINLINIEMSFFVDSLTFYNLSSKLIESFSVFTTEAWKQSWSWDLLDHLRIEIWTNSRI